MELHEDYVIHVLYLWLVGHNVRWIVVRASIYFNDLTKLKVENFFAKGFHVQLFICV